MAFIVQKAVQGVAAGIGLASESYQHHKEKKQHDKEKVKNELESESTRSINENGEEDMDHHDAAWELDEAQDEVVSQPASEMSHAEGKGIEDPIKIAEVFIKHFPPPAFSSKEQEQEYMHTQSLPLPVIIPQRRPENRTRGFIRAYAPLLENSFIDEETFLSFIHDINVVCLPNPWIQAINLASFATMALPTVTGMIVSMAIKKATDAMGEAHSRSKYDF
jgi:hypothetical protein